MEVVELPSMAIAFTKRAVASSVRRYCIARTRCTLELAPAFAERLRAATRRRTSRAARCAELCATALDATLAGASRERRTFR
jgi:hypothetical protein